MWEKPPAKNAKSLLPFDAGRSKTSLLKLAIKEIKSHVYGKRQTADSSWEFVRIENKQIKTVQDNSYG